MNFDNVKLSNEAEKLQFELCKLVPDYVLVRKLLNRSKVRREELACIAYEVLEFYDTEYNSQTDEKFVPTPCFLENLYTSIEMLLKEGLCPDDCVDGCSLLGSCIYFGGPCQYNCNKVLRLFLDKGANPNPFEKDAGEYLIDRLKWEVTFDAIEFGFDSILSECQGLLVLVGYGGKCSDGNNAVVMYDDLDYGILKYSENFDCECEKVEDSCHAKVYIIERNTKKRAGEIEY